MIKDYNEDGKIDYKDYLFYSLSIIGNIVFIAYNILH